MRIVEFTGGTLRFVDHLPAHAPSTGFVWVFLDREELATQQAAVQKAAQHLGGSPVLDVHMADLENTTHPSGYDYTSVYDLLVLRRLATEEEMREQAPESRSDGELKTFARIRSRAVGFVVFDRLLISVHPAGCYTADTFIKRFVGDAAQAEGLAGAARNRLPSNPPDLMLRMVNVMVDSYLELRKPLNAELDAWQEQLLAPLSRGADWHAYLTARAALHMLEDLSEGQHDAMQEWLDTLREQPPSGLHQADRDSLLARARDVIEHIQRVVVHVRRMEQGAETAIQIHFSALSHRTNETMRILTALTAFFLPLNLITGFFGMNFEYLPLIHSDMAMWMVLGLMAFTLAIILLVFWRRRFLARLRR
jgi:magnesium transporter